MELLFWLSIAFIAYVYAGYPVLLAAWCAIKGLRPQASRLSGARMRPHAPQDLPGITIIVAARDEAARLPGRIDNLLAIDYPHDRVQIIVASDGSTDDTAEVVAPYCQRVELLMLPPAGKAGALNAAVARAVHPIVIFADARQRFAPDAVRRLVSHFDDPAIGAVSGELVLDCESAAASGTERTSASTIDEGVGAYWKYEKWLRRHEATIGSTLGVTGAVYAMRRWLWQPLPADTILDDVLGPMRVVLRGYRVIFDGSARAFDSTPADASVELRRKVRTLAGNFQVLVREPRLLLPFVNPVWLQFMSHKVGRLLVPYALIALFVSSAWLAPVWLPYAAVFGAQLLFYALATYGMVLERRARTVIAATEVIREAA